MNRALSFSAVFLLFAAGIVACGGGQPTVSTQKGLGVGLAAMAAGYGGQGASQIGSNPAAGQPRATPGYGSEKSGSSALDQSRTYQQAPALQQSQSGITVVGYGSASADADNAIVEFYFTRYSVSPTTSPSSPKTGTEGGAADATTAQSQASPVGPITEADLKPVIDAVAGKGVSRDDIEFIGSTYYDPYTSTATLRVRVRDLGALDGIAQAAGDASTSLGGITLQSTNASYTLSDCTALEKAATKAAVDDGAARAKLFAEALGVGLGSLAGASNYSYSPYGGTACDSGFIGPYPLGGYTYAAGQSRSVQLFANVSITYAMK